MSQFVELTLTAKPETLIKKPNQPIKQDIIQLFKQHFDFATQDERDSQNDLFQFTCTINSLPFKGTYIENLHQTRPHLSLMLECGPIETGYINSFELSTAHTLESFLKKEHLPFTIKAVYKRTTVFD